MFSSKNSKMGVPILDASPHIGLGYNCFKTTVVFREAKGVLMAKTRSIDDLRSAHFHLIKTVAGPLVDMEQYFRDQISRLEAVYANIESISKNRTGVGLKTSTHVVQSNLWTDNAGSLLSRVKLYLRAMTSPDVVREYFPENPSAASRKIDRLHAISKVLTVSEHFGHAHLGDFRAELEALKAEGEAIFGAASVSRSEQKTEVEKLTAMKQEWEGQYQKIKFLLRGYFHGTSVDYAKFFDDGRPTKSGADKVPAAEFATSTPVVTAS